MYHTIHSQIVCRSVSDKIFNFQVHFRCMSLSSSPSWSSAPWTLWGQYFWSSIWIVYLIWGSGSLAVLHTYMEALVCWSVSDRIFNLQVHFWCLLLSPSLSSGPRHNGAILLWSHIQTLFILFVWSLAVFHIYMEAYVVISKCKMSIDKSLLTYLSNIKWRYRISANSFRGNYSFLNLTLCTVTFGHSTYRCGNYSRAETIRGNTVCILIRLRFCSYVDNMNMTWYGFCNYQMKIVKRKSLKDKNHVKIKLLASYLWAGQVSQLCTW